MNASPLGTHHKNSISRGDQSFEQNQNVGIPPIIKTTLNSRNIFTYYQPQHNTFLKEKKIVLSFSPTSPLIFIFNSSCSIIQTTTTTQEKTKQEPSISQKLHL
jgi:hypothetical protein